MNDKERYRRVLKLTERLVDKSKRGIPIIVEGPNDAESLRRIGVEGEVFCVKSSPIGFHDFAERFRKEKELIIMSDFDKEGRRLSRSLLQELSLMRVKADSSIRDKMEALLKNDIKGVEDLAGYLDKIKVAL